MHLFTSNSELTSAAGFWIKTWIGSLFIATLLIIGWELYCRSSGFSADSVEDTSELWGKTRELASQYGKKALVLVGASRIQLGLVPSILQSYGNNKPVQLAIDGNSFFPVLRDLANDKEVTGTILVSLTEYGMSNEVSDAKAKQWLSDYKARKNKPHPYLYFPLEKALVSLYNGTFAYRIAGAKPSHLLTKLVRGERTFFGHIETLPDRSRRAHYNQSPERGVPQRSAIFSSYEPFETNLVFHSRLSELSHLVDQIQDRGGKVILVRFPSSGDVWEGEERRYPKTVYWEIIESTIPAKAIHFKDHPSLQNIDLYDNSHLDFRNAERFTHALSKLIFN